MTMFVVPHISRRTLAVVLALGVAAATCFFVFYAIKATLEELENTVRVATLTKLRYSLFKYVQLYNGFPPPTHVHPETGAVASWRALLEIEQQSEAGRFYDLAQNWDSPQNLRAAEMVTQIGYALARPSTQGSLAETRFVYALRGNETAKGDLRPINIEDPENTVLIAETRRPGIQWTKPFDPALEAICLESPDHGIETTTFGFPGQLLLFADFAVMEVQKAFPFSTMQILVQQSDSKGNLREQLISEGILRRVYRPLVDAP